MWYTRLPTTNSLHRQGPKRFASQSTMLLRAIRYLFMQSGWGRYIRPCYCCISNGFQITNYLTCWCNASLYPSEIRCQRIDLGLTKGVGTSTKRQQQYRKFLGRLEFMVLLGTLGKHLMYLLLLINVGLMPFIGLISHYICARLLEKMRGKGSKWVKGAGDLEHIRGSEGLGGQRGHWEMIRRP